MGLVVEEGVGAVWRGGGIQGIKLPRADVTEEWKTLKHTGEIDLMRIRKPLGFPEQGSGRWQPCSGRHGREEEQRQGDQLGRF